MLGVSTFFFVLQIISQANNGVFVIEMRIRVYTRAYFKRELRINLIYMHCQPGILKHKQTAVANVVDFE